MTRKTVIGIFFVGLVMMLALEIFLIWIIDRSGGLPVLDLGWLNYLVGFLAIILGASMVVWSVSIQYTVGKGTPYPKVATQKLITTGPYALTRNPMTLGAFLFYLGFGFWFGSVAVIGIVLLIFAGLLRYIYVHETQELTQRFGEEYLEYRRKTPFLLPRLLQHL